MFQVATLTIRQNLSPSPQGRLQRVAEKAVEKVSTAFGGTLAEEIGAPFAEAIFVQVAQDFRYSNLREPDQQLQPYKTLPQRGNARNVLWCALIELGILSLYE